jgi:hypothetical protein
MELCLADEHNACRQWRYSLLRRIMVSLQSSKRYWACSPMLDELGVLGYAGQDADQLSWR